MAIDWSMNIGNLLTIAGFLGGGVFFVVAVRRDVDMLSARLKPLESAVTRLADILERQARQDERIRALERGVGWDDHNGHSRVRGGG